MVELQGGQWHITGVLDFGDAMFVDDILFDLLTPAIFMAQGDRKLLKELLHSYQADKQLQDIPLDKVLMAYALIRPNSNINFVMEQVPGLDKGSISPSSCFHLPKSLAQSFQTNGPLTWQQRPSPYPDRTRSLLPGI